MTYAIKEVFHTLQGEGANIGRSAVFIRFAGCNLWSGREIDRAQAACRFCDTDFVGGSRFSAGGLADQAASFGCRFAVLTGGEPLLQVDAPLISALRAEGFEIAVETNGTQPRPHGIDWLCVSPKTGAPLAVGEADELKVVFPQPGLLDTLSGFRSAIRWLSPMDGPRLAENIRAAAAYCMAHPEWRLAIQAHKTWSIR